MKPILRALALVTLAAMLAIPGAALAGPFFLELAGMTAAATGFSVFNANIRNSAGQLVSTRLSTNPVGAEVRINDDTGETLTAPTNAAIKSATLSLCEVPSIRGSTTVCTPADGTITVKRSGLYRASWCIQNSTVNAAVTITTKLFRKDGAGAAAEISPRIRGTDLTATGDTAISLCTSGLFTVTAAQAVATGGQIFDVRATASAGDIVVKDYRFSIVKVDELDPATP